MGSMTASKVNPWPEVVFMTWRPFAAEDIEQSSQAVLLNTKGGYCRSLFQESLFSSATAVTGTERPQEISEISNAAEAK
jgi:hypothetical protein